MTNYTNTFNSHYHVIINVIDVVISIRTHKNCNCPHDMNSIYTINKVFLTLPFITLDYMFTTFTI